MRIFLKKDKQSELIGLAKKHYSWLQLAEELKFSDGYLRNQLAKEKTLLSESNYNLLCSLSNVNFDKFIIKKLSDNWGQSKGGNNSLGSTIRLQEIPFSLELAEFVGAILGDGHICSCNSFNKSRKIGTYTLRIAGDQKKEREYHSIYLKKLVKNLFNLDAREVFAANSNTRFLDVSSKELVSFFISMGLKPGDKIQNQLTIPKWIWKEDSYLKACLRGLIDTDGSIFRMSKRDSNLIRIKFTNYNFKLIEDVRLGFIRLGFSPSKLTSGKDIYLSRQRDIRKYLKEIGFSNKKHKDRLEKFQSSMV